MGVPHSLGNLAWGCQIFGGAKSPVTPAFFAMARNLKLLLAQPKIGVCCVQ